MIDRSDRWPAVGAAVSSRMVALGRTQADVARAAELSAMTIRKVMNGDRHNVRPANLTKISRALNWPPDAIERMLGGEDASTLEDTAGSPVPNDPPDGQPVDRDTLGLAASIGLLRPNDQAVIKRMIRTMLDEQ